MTTVCTGWLAPHATKTLKDDGIADGKTSHGMCEACQQATDADLRRAEQYAAYRANPTLDPRD